MSLPVRRLGFNITEDDKFYYLMHPMSSTGIGIAKDSPNGEAIRITVSEILGQVEQVARCNNRGKTVHHAMARELHRLDEEAFKPFDVDPANALDYMGTYVFNNRVYQK